MKKSLFTLWGLIIIFSIINTCYAEKTIELDNPIIEYKREKYYGLQGFTVTDKHLFVIMTGYDDTKSILKVFDLDTMKEVKNIESNSLGHANDVTYNRNNNKIYVLASGGSNEIYVFDGDSFNYEESFELPLPARSITYIEDEDMYAIRTISVGYRLNNKFNLISKIPFIVGMNFKVDIGRQGWSYYNGYIYYANWSWIRYGGDGSNIIYVYDLNGKMQDIIYTNDTIGELEDVAFYNNKMILGFDGYDDNIKFYMIDSPTIEKEEIVEVVEVETEKQDSPIIIWISISILSIVSIVFIVYWIRGKK